MKLSPEFYWVCGAIPNSIPVSRLFLFPKSGNIEFINVSFFQFPVNFFRKGPINGPVDGLVKNSE